MSVTLKEITDNIDPSCFPPGLSQQEKYKLLGRIEKQIYNSPSGGGGSIWNGTSTSMAITVVSQPVTTNALPVRTITLPRQAEVLLGVIGVCGNQEVKGFWWSFLRQRWGLCDCGNYGIIDLGTGYCGVADLPPTGAKLKFTTTGVESTDSHLVIINGTDVNGNPITETVSLPLTVGSVSTTQTFYSVTQLTKRVTSNDVLAYLSVSSVDTFYSRYQPSETSADYRRYLVNGAYSATPALRCLVKRRYVKATQDNDLFTIDNEDAIEAGLKAYAAKLNGDHQNYGAFMSDCFAYLNGELARSQGDTSLGTVRQDFPMSGGSIQSML